MEQGCLNRTVILLENNFFSISFVIKRINMFELSIFNFAQISNEILAIMGTFFLTSVKAKRRMYGFMIFLVCNIPTIYLLVVSELWWVLATLPIWFFLSLRGLINNYKESILARA